MEKKFGTFKGVFVPSTEAILGTVLFLLMPLLVADVGLLPMLLIVILAHTVTISTSFSLADCATNLNTIEGGGMYALAKKSLGNAMGGSIGIMLYLAQAASVGFYSIGFAEPLQPLLAPLLDFIPLFTDFSPAGILLQKQVLASVFFIIFFLIVMGGADFTLKLQLLILVVLGVSVGAILLSPVLGISFEGTPLFHSSANIRGNRPLTLGIFFIAFTQFFPAVTGISTGVGMSGDLKDPRRSIVRGTFSAILVTMVVYLIVTVIFSFINTDLILTGYNGINPEGRLLTVLFGLGKGMPGGLPGLLVLLGVLFATSSSALSVFMTGPRTLQFLARDKILPEKLAFLEKDFKEGGSEPRYAVLVTFVLGFGIIWMGSINFAATVVGILFLVVYGWVNGAAFLERISRNPSFRPTFKGHWLISFYGFISCLAAISLFNWKVGILIFLSQFGLFRLILKYRAEGKLEGVWWGFLFRLITRALESLQNIVQGSRNWRPVISAFAYREEFEIWKKIAFLAEKLASYQGLVSLNIMCPAKFEGEAADCSSLSIPAVEVKTASPGPSILALMSSCQHSGIAPNTVLIQYNSKLENVKILNQALSLNKNILFLKNGERFKTGGTLDIWWRGEQNGNLMVLLAYIMNLSSEERDRYDLRIIRKLGSEENKATAESELQRLLKNARLSGEILILDEPETDFHDTLERVSASSSLIMMGLPGNYVKENESRSLFKLNEFFFDKEISGYSSLPAILFIRSSRKMMLMED
ncbi:MAG: amino acid permease [Spirochaetales bacterium]|nr:amino acid permease [Spirochaetales bacterium]